MSQQPSTSSPFLDTPAAAAYLGGLKKSTLERWRCRGGGPAYYKLGGRCFYKKEDLDAFAEARRYKTTLQPAPRQDAPPRR